MSKVKTICFDADDTLWHNESIFSTAHENIQSVLSDYVEPKELYAILLEKQRTNIPLMGFGIKTFTLCMLETALEVSNEKIDQRSLARVIEIGRAMMEAPVDLLPDVKDVLNDLHDSHRLCLVTKGDLKDQERKLEHSGLGHLFVDVEIVTEKYPETYSRIFDNHGGADACVMIGNSVKSDVLPAIAAGGYGVHVPYHVTWELEMADPTPDHARYFEADSIRAAIKIVHGLS